MKRMKNVVVFLVSLMLVLGASSAFAADGVYVSGNVGPAFMADSDVGNDAELSYDTGVAANAAVGTAMNDFRVEGELGYQNNDLDRADVDGLGSANIDGDVTMITGLVNGYYDFNNDSAWTPFITAGVGYANVEVDFDDFGSEDDSVLAYQVGAGVGYAATANVTIDMKYRYFATEDAEFGGSEDVEVASHNAFVGVRYTF